MPRSSSLLAWKAGFSAARLRDPRIAVRVLLGVLLLANLLAAWFAFNPLGGSAEELEIQATDLRKQVALRQASLTRVQKIADKVELARNEGDKFLSSYFLDRRTAYSVLVDQLKEAAKDARMQQRDHSMSYELIEGSENLGLLIINAAYEGTYPDLIKFINSLDRSPRLLIIESLQAQPQQGGQNLLVVMKLNTFVREEGAVPSGLEAVQPAESDPETAPEPKQTASVTGGLK